MIYFRNFTGYTIVKTNILGSMIRHTIAIGFLCFCTVMFYGCGEKNAYVIDSEEESQEETVSSFDTETDCESGCKDEEVQTEQMDFYVQVCGAVRSPGVYLVPSDSRVFHAIELAGGVCEDADVAGVNMARYVEDEMVIYVPLIGEHNPSLDFSIEESMSVACDNKVNINTASREMLMTLKGIGQVKADAIIAYRTGCGPFEVIEDLLKVDGIKQSTFDGIKEQISVGE